MRCTRIVLLALAVGLLAAAPASAATAAQIAAILDAQRTANGIPGGLVVDPKLSHGCDLHNAYLEANPDFTTPHEEIPGKRGYTKLGATIAGETVLAYHASFDGGHNPYQFAPFHLARLLDPELRVIGAAESHGWDCVVVSDPRTRHLRPPTRFYTYPGPGATEVNTDEFEYEAPLAPGDLLGIPQLTDTGPHLYVYAVPQNLRIGTMAIRSARLDGARGSIPLRWVDGSMQEAYALLPAGGVIALAPHPIAPGSYCAHVVERSPRYPGTPLVTLRHAWWFTTAGATPTPTPATCQDPPAARLRVDSLRVRGRTVRVVASASRSAKGRFQASDQRGIYYGRLKQSGRATRKGGRIRVTLTGRLPGGIFRVFAADVTFHRTDGGSDELASRIIHLKN